MGQTNAGEAFQNVAHQFEIDLQTNSERRIDEFAGMFAYGIPNHSECDAESRFL